MGTINKLLLLGVVCFYKVFIKLLVFAFCHSYVCIHFNDDSLILFHLCTALLLSKQISIYDRSPLQSRSRNVDVISSVKSSFRWSEVPVLSCLNNKKPQQKQNKKTKKTRKQKYVLVITYSWQELSCNFCNILHVHVQPPNLQLGFSANIHTVIMLSTEGQHIWMPLTCLCAFFVFDYYFVSVPN